MLVLFPIQYLFAMSYDVEISKYYLVFVYISAMAFIIRKYSVNHSLTIFMGTYGIFIMGHVFMDIFFNIPLRLATKWNYYLLSEETYVTVNSSYSLAIIGVILGTSIIKNKLNEVRITKNGAAIKILRYSIIIMAPIAIYKTFIDYQQIVSGGYLTLYSGLVRSSLFVRLGWYYVVIAMPILLLNITDKKSFKRYILLYSAINIFGLVRGDRFSFVIPILYFIWFYYKYISKYRMKKQYIVIVVVLIFLVSSLSNYNSKRQVKIETDIIHSMLNLGGTYYLHAYYIDYQDQILGPTKLYFLGPVLDYINRIFDKSLSGHTRERVINSYSLDHKLTYAVGQSSYLSGRGLGGNYVTELFAIHGIISVLLFSLIIGYYINQFEYMSNNSDIYKIISWYWVSNLFFMSRGSISAFIMGSLLTITLYKIVLIVGTLVEHKT